MTNLPYSSRIVRVSEKTYRSSCVRAAKGMASVTKYSDGADFVTRSNYFVTSDRRSGTRRPLVYHYWMLLAAADFDRPTADDYAIRQFFDPESEKERRRYRDVCPALSPSIGLIAVFWAELSRDVSSRPRRPSYTPFAN